MQTRFPIHHCHWEEVVRYETLMLSECFPSESRENHSSQGNPRRYQCEGQSRGHAVKILWCMLSISPCTHSTADSGSVYTESLSGFPEDPESQPDGISRNETLCGKQILLAEAQHGFILYVQVCRAIMRQNKDRACYLCTGALVIIPE